MKSIKHLLLFGLAFVLVLNSCTLDKRLYRSGYNVEWFNSKIKPDVKTARVEIKNVDENKTLGKELAEAVPIPVETSTTQGEAENTITASVDNNSTIILSHQTVSFNKASSTAKDISFAEAKVIEKQAVKQAKAEKAKSPSGGGGKTWIAALLLCIFLGGIGIHRFYLGYTWQGVVQLLTLGGCGVWALIDLIRIITRDLKPKDGDYTD
jgi:hypothetical protein